MPQKPKGPYLTPQEVAVILRVHRATIYTWIKHNKLPFIRLPSGDVRISEDELAAWLVDRHRSAK